VKKSKFHENGAPLLEMGNDQDNEKSTKLHFSAFINVL